MNRRGFLGTMIGGIAASAAVRTFPFRVYSFPSQVIIPEVPVYLPFEYLVAAGIKSKPNWEVDHLRHCVIVPKSEWLKELDEAMGRGI